MVYLRFWVTGGSGVKGLSKKYIFLTVDSFDS